MARLFTTGFEIGPVGGPDAVSAPTGTVTRDTGTFRSGASSFKFDSGAGNAAASILLGNLASTGSAVNFFRGYVNFAQLPGSTIRILWFNGVTAFSARITSAGKLQLWNDGTAAQIGSDSAATLVTGTWYRIEISTTNNAGSTQFSAVELRLDGTTVASTSGTTVSLATGILVGWQAAPGANSVHYWDDVGANDNSGAANNTWLGSGKVILMRPISDNARGAWTAGAGGTTNLWDAVNNTPPVGVAEASATNTSQIKNRTTTNPTNCDLNLDTYTNAGLGTLDTVNAAIAWLCHGEDPATGTKTGAVQVVSNPAIAAATFTYGNDAGLQGTYLGLWGWASTLTSDAPSVTKGTAVVIRATCTTGATAARSASCCFLGMYVDYTPISAFVPRNAGVNLQDPGAL